MVEFRDKTTLQFSSTAVSFTPAYVTHPTGPFRDSKTRIFGPIHHLNWDSPVRTGFNPSPVVIWTASELKKPIKTCIERSYLVPEFVQCREFAIPSQYVDHFIQPCRRDVIGEEAILDPMRNTIPET